MARIVCGHVHLFTDANDQPPNNSNKNADSKENTSMEQSFLRS
jgi:hypothetical protein